MTSIIRKAINLNYRHFERTKHGIVCIGTWMTHTEDGGRTEPCLALLDVNRPMSAGRTVPVIIPMSIAWAFAVSDDAQVGDRNHTAESITEWRDENLLTASFIQILDAINDCLRDLYSMPPKPDFGGYSIGEITITDRNSGKTIKQAEIQNDV